MKNLFYKTLKHKSFSFQYTNKPTFEEREIHNYLEILYYLGDDTTLVTENHQQTIRHGSLLILPEKKYHFIKTENTKDIKRLKISIMGEEKEKLPMLNFTEIKIFENLNDNIRFVLSRLCEILTNDKSDSFHAYASFLMLWAELGSLDSSYMEESISHHTETVSKLIDYISGNLANDLSIAKLSEKIHISPSTITHTFKKEMGISLHEYIKENRLTLAKDMISKYHNPSNIFSDCGYGDYSSFYKAYVKFFGSAPSK